MGIPTTANYIVVATLMAPVVVELAAQTDLAVPLIAVHMFVFYFGIMADVTPPVGLAAFAAGGDLRRRSDEGRLAGLCATSCAPRCCRSSSSSIRKSC